VTAALAPSRKGPHSPPQERRAFAAVELDNMLMVPPGNIYNWWPKPPSHPDDVRPLLDAISARLILA
jgi:hypothetical protein